MGDCRSPEGDLDGLVARGGEGEGEARGEVLDGVVDIDLEGCVG